ncbi:MAG: GGDEF domain-containing protein [Actinobacteria bacterium]|jgi:diguanylate cyclase (GGDEF)-like protein|nr:GGDEF domain-containing protein [Actinomycetota bacterium]
MRDRVWFLAAASGAIALPAVLVVGGSGVKEVAWVVLGTLAFAGAWIATRRQAPDARSRSLLVGTAIMLAGTLAEFTVLFLPDNSLLEQYELLFYPVAFLVLAVALNGIATRRFPDGDPEGRIDALIVLVGAATILIVTVSLQGPAGSLVHRVAVIAMPLTMAPILAACIRLLITGAHRLPAAWGMTGAAATNLVATVILTVDPDLTADRLVLGLWIIAFGLLGMSLAHASFATLAAPTAVDPKQWQLGRLAAIGLALLALPASNLHRQMTLAEIASTSAATLCVLLVLARLARVLIERNAAERELARAALHDPLTGLPNRTSLTDALTRDLARAARDGTPLSVLFIDLDGFKAINDTHGHAAGDELLTAVARRIETAVRGGDLATRLAGDEFVVLCPATSLEDARSTADRITRELGTPYPLSCGEVGIGASIGAAEAQRDDDVERLLHRADVAMYSTKAGHREALR